MVEHVGDVNLRDKGDVARWEAFRYVRKGPWGVREVEGGLLVESVYAFKVTDRGGGS